MVDAAKTIIQLDTMLLHHHILFFGIVLHLCVFQSLAGRTVLVVSNVIDEDGGDFSQPVVEVYDFLSRTWRLFEPPISTEPQQTKAEQHDKKDELNPARHES